MTEGFVEGEFTDADEYLAMAMGTIEKYGWLVQSAGNEFYYTAGLYRPKFDFHPEFVLTIPTDPAKAATMLNILGERVEHGEHFQPGPIEGLLKNDVRTYLLRLASSADERCPLSVANTLFGVGGDDVHFGHVAALQLCVADRANHLPWEPGYDAIGLPQYLVGIPPVPPAF